MSANLSPHSVVPDAIEPVRAWRAWRIAQTADGLRLQSITFPGTTYWPARERMVAECRRTASIKRCLASPKTDCSCGIYAARTVADARPYVNSWNLSREYAAEKPVGATVWLAIGRVDLWGKVIEHDQGWRAQYAYPRQLLIPAKIDGAKTQPDNLDDVAAELRDAYRVPVLIVFPEKPSLLERIKRSR